MRSTTYPRLPSQIREVVRVRTEPIEFVPASRLYDAASGSRRVEWWDRFEAGDRDA